MEIFELKYFLAVAQTENVNKAADLISISAGSLSKTIARLEQELQTVLFFRTGRGIQLTPEGQLLKKRAADLVQLEEDIRLQLTGAELGSLNVYLSSEEILQATFGVDFSKVVHSLFGHAKVQFYQRPEAKALEQVFNGEAHFAFITQDPPTGLVSKVLAKVDFVTCASKEHPLVKKHGSKAIPIEEILKNPFVSPEGSILGKIAKASSMDGWRDDKFPRIISYRVGGIKLMENLIKSGMALGYLPNYFVQSAGLLPIKVSGCPYTCQQTVRIVCRDPSALGWTARLWDKLA